VVAVADLRPVVTWEDDDEPAPVATATAPASRPLRAAEITAIGAGRRLYRTEIIGPDATVNTILCFTAALEPAELAAMSEIGERSFGICARAGALYQQAADLLADLRER
jgi:hypothetical protein